MRGKLTRRGFVALAGGLLLSGTLAGTALAQETTETPWGPGACPMGFGGGPGAGWGPGAGPMAGVPGQAHAAIASTLGMSTDELFAALRSGKTIAQLSQEKGIDLETVVQAALAAHHKALDDLVQAGQVTQAHADWMESRMEANIRGMVAGQHGPGMVGGPGFGPGSGHGRHGPGMGPGFGPGWHGHQ